MHMFEDSSETHILPADILHNYLGVTQKFAYLTYVIYKDASQLNIAMRMQQRHEPALPGLIISTALPIMPEMWPQLTRFLLSNGTNRVAAT